MKLYRHLRLAYVFLVCALLVCSAGCHKERPLALALVIDLTASTDAAGRAKAFQTIHTWFEQKRLKRGDRITIVPVTGDAWSDSQGRILRFQLSEKREAYDADIKRLKEEVESQIEVMEAEAAAHPYNHSDVMGAVRLAAADLAQQDAHTRKVLIVLSDFVQDDPQANFKAEPALANEKSARTYARKLAADPTAFKDCAVYLGLLRSAELKNMPLARRGALQLFWLEYFQQSGARSITIAIDGPGQMDAVFSIAE
jgi:hypothetical protein